jgi:DNA gyrase subunit B
MQKLRQLTGNELRTLLHELGFEIEATTDKHERYMYQNAKKALRFTIPTYNYYVHEPVLENLVRRFHGTIDEGIINQYFHVDSTIATNLETQNIYFDHVRRRPSSYIGAKNSRALHTILDWSLASVIDQAAAGYCNEVTITIQADQSLVIEDNGSQLPQQLEASPHQEWLAGTLDNVMQGVKARLWGQMNYRIITALSKIAYIRVTANNTKWSQRYTEGIAPRPAEIAARATEDTIGTHITLQPDFSILDPDAKFNDADLMSRLQELAFMTPALRITLVDERKQPTLRKTFHSSDGLATFLQFVNRDREVLHKVIHGRATRTHRVHPGRPPYEIEIDFACQFTTDDTEMILSYANYEQTLFGGVHVDCLHSGVISPFISQADKAGLIDRKTTEIISADFFPGFTGVIHILTPFAEYCGQFRDQLSGDDVGHVTYLTVFGIVEEFIKHNPEVLPIIINRTLDRNSQRVRRRFGEWTDDLLPPIPKLR